jgi:sugar O-acyltransferase (sialic acid O-acetyltransferase NeuD family)
MTQQSTDIIIIGAGGHAAELDDYIRYSGVKSGSNTYSIVGLIDDNPKNYARYSFAAPLLGSIKDHRVRTDCKYLIGIANLQYRKLFIERFLSEGAAFTSFIHPDTYISHTARIGIGTVIAPNVNLGPNVVIGDFTLVNSRCSMGHDTVVGKYNFLCPNVCFSGNTSVGDENLFGINSATIPGIRVGNRNKIAAGMTLDSDIADDSVVFYRFKEKIIAIPKSYV